MNFSLLRKSKETIFFVVDLLMVLLVIINLLWIIFEWHFGFKIAQDFFIRFTPSFYDFYNEELHKNFLKYDVWFVVVFIVELIIRWAVAIKRKTYHKWFFYPFVHWYEVLGCIPLGTFRFLRLFRVISMIYRLQKLGVIDLQNTWALQLFKKYYEVLVEEVSDRVVVNVLENVQDEIKHGSPITDRMISEVVHPHKKVLVEWMSHRVRRVTAQNYAAHKDEIRQYLERLVKDAVAKNNEMKQLKGIPLVGNTITSSIETAIGDITFNVINSVVEDLASDHNKEVIEEITDIAFDVVLLEEEDKDLNQIAINIAIDSIELVKEQVKIQQWKLKEEREREKKKKVNAL
ncbi:MAG: hypothetical protein COA57_15535 [Flavobacteriales bacterium]|nr:MAG: hypothetical protein COA57_15535 [Flavobacteriales bacterium]